ncbi:MAG: phenylalanine--tRNA ligase subunit beta [Lentisphaeria bacterium]
MKTSLNWLRNYVDIPWAPKELAERLTLAGLEVEGIETTGAIPAGVVVAEILSRQPHPNADKLSVCQVSTGVGEPLQIVCGAPNCDAGKRVPLATIGTVFPDFKIKKAKLRGVESNGMMCSARELGLSEDHDGLLILPADTPLGKPLTDLFTCDTVIDWEVTPNRPDWLSHLGIAREIAALTGGQQLLRRPAVELKPVPGTRVTDVAAVEVREPELCPRYTARVIRNVKIGPSPDWLRRDLEAVGLRSINNVVDITNFVMLEYGEPLHAFDHALLAGGRIVVRRAAPGETFTTLDGRQHKLTADNLLIADAAKGVALAGIMGGENSGIRDTTTTVLVESAQFLPSNIRATARQLGLATDSSHRFERGVSRQMVADAGARAAALICELAGGELLDGVIDISAPVSPLKRIPLRFARINALLGLDLNADTLLGCLTRLGFTLVSRDATGAVVEVPEFRLDLAGEADLAEEVVRMHGLDRVPAAVATARLGGRLADDAFVPLEEARAQLLGLGLDEAVTYSMFPPKTAVSGTGVAENELVILSNPISADTAAMRPSLLPGIVQSVANNLARNTADLALFEFGRVHVRSPQLPEERWQAAIALTGRPHAERFGDERRAVYDFSDLKGVLEGWLDARRLTGWRCQAVQHPAFAAGRGAEIRLGDEQLAVFGEAAPELTRDLRLKAPLFIAIVELGRLVALPAVPRRCQPLPQFPATTRDISLVAAATLTTQEILDTIRAAGCPWLEKAELFDLFSDDKVLGAGQRSLAFSLTYRHPERTLTDDEATAAHEKVKAFLAGKLAVQYR